VDVEVSHYQEGKPKIWKKSFRLDGVDLMVDSGGVGIDASEAVEIGAKRWFLGGDLEGKDVVFLPKPGEHHVVGKK